MDYDYLKKKLNDYDASMKELFQKRMAVLEEIILADKNVSSPQFLEKAGDYDMEYEYFLNMQKSMDNRYKYKLNPVLDKLNTGCREKNEVKVVCYQGLECSYSESAAKSLFNGAKLINRLTFEDVFKSVFEETADIGIVPIENSTAGYINDVYDLLLKYDLFINHTYEKKVDHCLACSHDAELDDIKEVYSHPQALAQCSEYITRNKLVTVNEINTAVAAQKTAALNKKNAACICSQEAAERYGLKIIEKQINDQKKNYTRFAAVSKKLLVEDNHNKVSIVFNVLHETGSLSEVLSTFAYYGCNLSYINSRPNRISTWEYMFYVDFEGNLCDKKIKSMLSQLKTELPYMKVLGSFKA
jgi:chorismate mutase/prephenate dehydratase